MQRKQIVDESFSSFYVELWVLCDEMQAMNGDSKNAKAFEMKVVTQFVHGLHDRLVKIDVKKYLSKEDSNFCGKDIQAAQYYAEEHEVETSYAKNYETSWNLVNEVKEPKIAVANINQDKRVRIDPNSVNRNDDNNRERLLCYNCQKPGHFARDCRSKPYQNQPATTNYEKKQYMQQTNKNSANDQLPWPYDPKFYRQNKTSNGCNYNDNSQNHRNDLLNLLIPIKMVMKLNELNVLTINNQQLRQTHRYLLTI